VLIGLCLAAAMLLTSAVAWSGVRLAAVALVLQAVVWLQVDAAFEGPRLVRFSLDHGFVMADLVAVAAVGVAVLAWRRAGRRPG